MPTTSPDSFFYPDDTSNNDLTQHVKDLADAVQAKFTAQETWTNWNPVFDTTANGGANGGFDSAGTGGHMQGHYRRSAPGSGALIYAEFHILLGTGFTTDTGSFVLILPVEAYDWGAAGEACRNATVGEWSMRDDSSSPINHYNGTLGYYNQSIGDKVHFAGAPQDGASAVNSSATQTARYRLDSTDPVTWAAGDNLTGHLLYRAN